MIGFDLYFISIFDSIIGVSIVFSILGIVAAVAWIICVCLNAGIEEDTSSSYDMECLRTNNMVIKISKPFVRVGIVCLIIATFLPSTKQGYMIYGISNTVEYIKSNKTARELPNKAIVAIDRWLDEEMECDKDTTNNQK